MHKVDEYLRLAASNSKIAENRLKDAEDELHTLTEKLETCLELIKRLPRDESLLRVQSDMPVNDRQLVNVN
jgi:hypothetical protein